MEDAGRQRGGPAKGEWGGTGRQGRHNGGATRAEPAVGGPSEAGWGTRTGRTGCRRPRLRAPPGPAPHASLQRQWSGTLLWIPVNGKLGLVLFLPPGTEVDKRMGLVCNSLSAPKNIFVNTYHWLSSLFLWLQRSVKGHLQLVFLWCLDSLILPQKK